MSRRKWLNTNVNFLVPQGLRRIRQYGIRNEDKLNRELYDGVESFLMFIGYPRSGHTLVSSLLDAHPNALVANEFDVIGEWQKWTKTNRNKYYLFDQLYLNSKMEADTGYRSATIPHRFNYSVPGQWQGTFNQKILVSSSCLVPMHSFSRAWVQVNHWLMAPAGGAIDFLESPHRVVSAKRFDTEVFSFEDHGTLDCT